MLTIHALSSGTLATLTEVDDRLYCILGGDLNLVEGVLDDCGGHGFGSLWYEYSIRHFGGSAGFCVPVWVLAHGGGIVKISEIPLAKKRSRVIMRA